ncbi:MAG: T9SS type A sorting domain-containing protein [Phaeodactylibacter sp.]|nr:T9SS type A sorting domain-containing protein [Phaeodactylibacter sp.]MCB9296102.1 T9SS type A sorting domain-containing protein [Lewinellaceae bacterium]
MKVFPNPAREQLFLSFPYPPHKAVQVALTGMDGRHVLSVGIPDAGADGFFRLALPELPAGAYLLRVTAGERHFTRRIVIR